MGRANGHLAEVQAVRGVKAKRSRMYLRMARTEVVQLRRLAKLADVTLSQLVRVIIVLEIQRMRAAEKKKR